MKSASGAAVVLAMLYIIGWGVITMITLRILQASCAPDGRWLNRVTIGSVVVGVGFVFWLFAHWFLETPVAKSGGF